MRQRVRHWVEAYAGDALPEQQSARLADRLSTVAAEWARCSPQEANSFLEKVKSEVLSEFLPPERTKPHASTLGATQASFGHSFVIKGELTGAEPIYIDGHVEGSIVIPGNRVTIGRNAVVTANIHASEIVILGKVRGDLAAPDRVDIRKDGSLTGNVVSQRITIEDGAFFKGGIDIRKGVIAVANSAEEAERVMAARLAERVIR